MAIDIVLEGENSDLDSALPAFLVAHSLPAYMHGRQILMAIMDGTIVGTIGRLPMRWHSPRLGSLPGHWIVNGAVRADCQGLGIGKRLYQTAYADSDRIGGMISAKLDPLPRHLSTWSAAAAQFNRLQRYLRPVRRGEPTAVAPSTPLPEALTLWDRVAERYGVTTARTKDWLRQRYVDHPKRAYRWLSRDDAVAVVRHDGPAVRIVDLYGTAEGVRAVLEDVVHYAEGQGVEFVDFYCCGSPDDLSGWWAPDWQDPAQPPPVFNPPDATPREMVLGVWTREPALADELERPTYVTRGDAGADRP